MKTVFLRFPDEVTFNQLVPRDDSGALSVPDLIVIGPIYEGGEWDEEGNVVTAPVAKPGFHVNVPNEAPPELQPYVIERPTHPYCIYFGDETQ